MTLLVEPGREGEAIRALNANPILDRILSFAQDAMLNIEANNQEGDLLAARICTACLRALATDEIDQEGMQLGGVILLGRVRQILYDARTALYTHSVTDSGTTQLSLTPEAKNALDRLSWVDPLFGNKSVTSVTALAELESVLRGVKWPTTT